MKTVWIGSALILLAIVSSCRDDDEPGTPYEPVLTGTSGSIDYTVSGGFAGGIHTQLTVDRNGHVTLFSVYPPFEGELTTSERAELVHYTCYLWSQPDSLRGSCMDDFTFVIRWTEARGSKTVVADGCALSPSTGGVPYPVVSGIVQTLESVAARIKEQEAPWRGMEANFMIDASSYGLDEPIRLTYTLTNPTSFTRSLSFPHSKQFWFTVDKANFPAFHYSYPMEAFSPWSFPDSSSPTTRVLLAGEEKNLVYIWDHSLIDSRGVPDTLGVGSYHLRMGLLAGDFAVRDFDFDVYDKQIPIKGEISPDFAGADASSMTYTIQLKVTNWTQSPLTLNFGNSQRLAVELWDLDINPPTALIYSTEILLATNPQTLVLAPLETVVIADTVQKAAMKPGYFWTLAKVRLLCTNFPFEREGQLQIFRQ